MLICQWHIDVPFGKQKDALDVLRDWSRAETQDKDLPAPTMNRVMVGHIGVSPTHIISESQVNSLADWEKLGQILTTGRYQQHSENIARFIVPGSQHWLVYRVIEDMPGSTR